MQPCGPTYCSQACVFFNRHVVNLNNCPLVWTSSSECSLHRKVHRLVSTVIDRWWTGIHYCVHSPSAPNGVSVCMWGDQASSSALWHMNCFGFVSADTAIRHSMDWNLSLPIKHWFDFTSLLHWHVLLTPDFGDLMVVLSSGGDPSIVWAAKGLGVRAFKGLGGP